MAEGETSAQELKKERTNLGKVELRTKQRGKRELALLLQGYYEVFDPRHPAYREDFPNAQDLSKWEAEKGHPWTPKPKHPEDNR